MLLLLSPAKTFAPDVAPEFITATQPIFTEQNKALIDVLRGFSSEDIQSLMKVSEKIGDLNHDRYHNWNTNPEVPALHGYAGDVYRGLKGDTPLSSKDWDFAQTHLRILSGLYGVLKPKDAIKAHRLEMGTKLKIEDYTNLYAFWGTSITKSLEAEVQQNKHQAVINLASKEYFSALQPDAFSVAVIDIVFQQETPKGFKIIAIHAKKARGIMARYIIDNQITNPIDILGFTKEGYAYDAERSTDTKYIFTRKK